MTPCTFRSRLGLVAAAALLSGLPLYPQQASMPGMNMSDMSPSMPQMPGMRMQPKDLISAQLNHMSSGTTVEPASTPMYMLMGMRHGWTGMLHGEAFVTDLQQFAAQTPQGRRGGDKLFSTNWIMPMAMRRVGPGQLTLRTMLSLEPATITSRRYPLLFQQGETAFGAPIVDGQHPHNFFMELAALYDIRLGEHSLLSFYAAPIGDPAIGPVAYPHRITASENPLAALGHHQEDSTHIAFNVFTAAYTWRWARLELSGFHGGEPSEQRWGFQPSPNGLAVDSYSARLTISPNTNWTGQYSIARIASPEALYPHEDQQRQTASLMYNHPLGTRDANGLTTGNWSNTLVWGRTRSITNSPDEHKVNSYLAESLLRLSRRNYVWTRIENVGRTNELLLQPGAPLPAGFEEDPIGHVQAYSFGYDRDLPIARHLVAAPGAQFTTYTTPDALQSTYGHHPWGVAMFVRFRLQP